jgi:hypothetical protein
MQDRITDAAHFNNLAEISSRPIAFPSCNEESNLKTALGVVKSNVKTVSAQFQPNFNPISAK